jgi:hypothetical protein
MLRAIQTILLSTLIGLPSIAIANCKEACFEKFEDDLYKLDAISAVYKVSEKRQALYRLGLREEYQKCRKACQKPRRKEQ